MAITLEELKKLLEDVELGEKAPPIPYKKHNINKFIQEFKIEQGEYFYPNYIIYYTYMIFSRHRKYKCWGKTEFFRNFSKVFKSHRTATERGYKLNNYIVVTADLYTKAKSYSKRTRKSDNEKKAKKKNQIECEVSSS